MGNRTAKYISALVASVLAGVPLAAVSQEAPTAPKAAADDCLASPKGAVPQGQHWYYRIERGTKRQCWYLRDEVAKGTQQATQQGARAATPAPAAVTPARKVSDARAEWTMPVTAPDTTASIPADNPAAKAQRPNGAADGSAPAPAAAARWPDASAANPSPAPQAAPTIVADAAPAPLAAAPPSAAPLAAASAPVDKPTGSLQTLLLVVGAALALAGITASLIYRFAGGRRVHERPDDGARRRVNWNNREGELEEARAPWLETAKPATIPSARLRSGERPLPAASGFARAQAARPDASTSELDMFEAADETRSEAGRSEPDETPVAFDIEEAEAPRKPAADVEAAADMDADKDHDAIDIDAITAILERLAKEGPKLGRPAATAGSAAFEQSRQDRSDVRA